MNQLPSDPMPPRVPVVLIVDDSPGFRRALTKSLEQQYPECFEILQAGSALAALTLLENVPVDVVVSDLDMGSGMDGDQLLEAIGKRWPAIKRALVSSWATGSMVIAKPYPVMSKQLAGWLICDRIAELAGIR